MLMLGLPVVPVACTSETPVADGGGNMAASIAQVDRRSGGQIAMRPVSSASAVPPTVPRETVSTSVPVKKAEAGSYRSIGTEPFWAVTVQDGILLLERPDQPPQQIAVEQQVQSRSIIYSGDGFTMAVTPGPCSDGMSDAIWSDRVQIAFAEGTLKGCGGLRRGGE